MSTFTIHGKIVPFVEGQWNIEVQNAEEFRNFWQSKAIATKIDWAGTAAPLVTVSAQHLVNLCQAGDVVNYTIEAWDRADGRRIRGLSLEVVDPNEV